MLLYSRDSPSERAAHPELGTVLSKASHLPEGREKVLATRFHPHADLLTDILLGRRYALPSDGI